MKKVTFLMALCLVVGMSTAIAQKKAAFLSIYESTADTWMDDDEKAAAQWFTTTYGGDFLPVSALAATDLSQYGVLWLHVDDEYFPAVPDEFLETAVKTKIINYYKGGGNLLLTIHGVAYLPELGRYDKSLQGNANGPVGAGTGASNPDTWYASAVYGTYIPGEGRPNAVVFDNSSDPIFAGLTYEMHERDNGNEYKMFPLIGPGWKEDHNCFWNLDAPAPYSGNDNPLKFPWFYDNWKATPLASWGHV